ncbi:MAG: right-handed parallel beta-helix repeat-containing protein [Candidatus Micrarchaeota archaeon]
MNNTLTGNGTFNGIASCIYINASNVLFSCAFKTLTGNESGTTTGIYVDQVSNVSIHNCSSISSYAYGVRFAGVENSTIANTTVWNNTIDGFYIGLSSSYNNILDSITYNNSRFGLYLLQTSRYNNLSNNRAFNNSDSGFSTNDAQSNRFVNNTAANNTLYGFVLGSNSQSNNLTNNRAFNNSDSGFALDGSTVRYNILLNNSALNNSFYGFYLFTSHFNTLAENLAVINTRDGFYLLSSDNNSLENNTAYNNYRHGIYLNNGADRNNLTNNSLYTNAQNGIYFLNSNYNNLINNTLFTNLLSGILIDQTSTYNNLSNNDAYGNLAHGFSVTGGSTNNLLSNNSAYSNSGSGFHAFNSFTNTWADNDAWENRHGFNMSVINESIIANNTAFNNSIDGFLLLNISYSNFSFNYAFNNSQHGFELDGYDYSVVQFFGDVAFLNTQYGIYIHNTIGAVAGNTVFNNTWIYNQSKYLFQEPIPVKPTVFNNLTLGYNLTIGLINYLAQISTDGLDLWTNESDFRNGTIVIRPTWVSLNDSAAADANQSANVTIYTDDCSNPIWKKLGFPVSFEDIVANGTLYSTSRTCSGASAPFTATFNVSGFSGFAMNDTSGCVNLSDSSTWGAKIVNKSGILHVNRNTTLCRDTYFLANYTSQEEVLLMNSSNIYLDCNGSILDGIDGDGWAISTNPSVVENDTIENCTVRNYEYGFGISGTNRTRLAHNTAYNLSNTGFAFTYANYSTVFNNTAYNSTSSGFGLVYAYRNSFTNNSARENAYGFAAATFPSNQNNFTNNSASNNSDSGFAFSTAGSNRFVENTAYRNANVGFGFSSSNANTLINNTAYDNIAYGFYLTSSDSNTLTNNRAFNSTFAGFFILESDFNILANDLAYNNTNYGIELNSSNYANISNSSAYLNNVGFYVLASNYTLVVNGTANNNTYGLWFASGANYNTILNSTAYNNSQFGFLLDSSSSFNAIGGSTAFYNDYGFVIYPNAENNTLENNTGYSNTAYEFYITTTQYNNLTNNTAYTNTNGFAIYVSNYTLLRDNTAYDVTNAGFGLFGSGYSTLTNNLAYDADFAGFWIDNFFGTPGENNTLINNTARDGLGYGFYIGDDYNNLTNNTAYNTSSSGFILDGALYSNLVNSLSYDNDYGFYVSASSSNVFMNSTAYWNTNPGFYISSSNYNTFANSTSHSNGAASAGFYVLNSFLNNFTDTLAYNNSGYGVYFTEPSIPTYNFFNNTLIYNQSNYLFASTSAQNNFTNLTLGYNISIGLISYFFLNVTSVNIWTNEPDFSVGTAVLRDSWVSLDDANQPQGSAPANITIYTSNCSYPVLRRTGFPITLADILANGTIYPTSINCTGASAPFTATFNVSGLSGFAMGQITTILNLTFLPSNPVTFGTETNVSCNASNSEVFLRLYQNSTEVANGTLYIEHLANLSAGTYNYTCNTTGTANYSAANISGILTVNKNATLLNLTFLPSDNVTYKTETNVSCNASNSEVILNLYRNGSLVGGPANNYVEHLANLSAGLWNYTCNVSETENYTSAELSGILTVNKNTSSCSLSFDPLSPQTYNTTVNASCSCNNPEASFTLWRNTTDVTATENNQFVVIPAGVWNYTCNVSETENYTAAINSSLYTMNKNATYLTLTFLPSNNVTYKTETNVSCNASNSEATLNLYENGTLRATGATYIDYLANLSAGTYNYTCNTTGSQNYTSAETSGILSVNKNTTILTLTALPSSTVNPGTETNVSCAANNAEANLTLFRNGIEAANGTLYVQDLQNLSIGSYAYICNTTGSENYTDASVSGTLTVRRPSEAGAPPEEMFLEIIAPDNTTEGTPTQIEVAREEDGQRLIGARVDITCDGELVFTDWTDAWGRVFFTPDEPGTCTILASFGDFQDAEKDMDVLPQPRLLDIGFQPDCAGSVITVTTEECTGGALDGGGYLACGPVPVEGSEVSIYRCPEPYVAEVVECDELIGTYTTDAGGQVTTGARDGFVRIVAEDPENPSVSYETSGELPSTEQCEAPPQLTISFDPSCEGSTITVTTTQCFQQDLPDTQPICTETPMEGERVDVFRCPELPYQSDVQPECTESLGTFTTDSDGQVTIDEWDGRIRVYMPANSHAGFEGFYDLSTTQECAECLADSDCPQDYVCRDYECIPYEQLPPDERRCTVSGECPSGFGCSQGLCSRMPPGGCASDADCPSGFECREGSCTEKPTEEEVVTGLAGVLGGLQNLLQSVINVIVTSSWLIILLLLLLLLWWLFFWKRKKKKKAPVERED